MLYKIETAYPDYRQVKRNVPSKDEYITDILEIIQKDCDDIVVASLKTEAYQLLKERKVNFIIQKEEKKIIVLPKETDLLYALFQLEQEGKKWLQEAKDTFLTKPVESLLKTGKCLNKVECIRDFNGFSWNSNPKEIKQKDFNILYQDLLYLVGYEFLEKPDNREESFLVALEKELKESYGEVFTTSFLEMLYQLAIYRYSRQNPTYQEELEKEKEALEKEEEKWKHEESYLQKLTLQKEEHMEKVKRLDKLIRSKDALLVEFAQRNAKTQKEEEKIFCLSDLVEILNKEKEESMAIVNKVKQELNPNQKEEIQKRRKEKLALLNSLDLECEPNEQTLQKQLIALQELVLEAMVKEWAELEEKAEITNEIYEIRYYNMLYLTDTKQLGTIAKLKSKIEQLEKNTLERAIQHKVITEIVEGKKELNWELISPIFHLRIMELGNIEIEVEAKEKQIEEGPKTLVTYWLEVNLYNEILEETYEITITKEKQEKIGLKLNKKIKLWE